MNILKNISKSTNYKIGDKAKIVAFNPKRNVANVHIGDECIIEDIRNKKTYAYRCPNRNGYCNKSSVNQCIKIKSLVTCSNTWTCHCKIERS